jgi:hypothetical protein
MDALGDTGSIARPPKGLADVALLKWATDVAGLVCGEDTVSRR